MATASVPTPKNILRGHRAQVHAAVFLRNNDRLATGDADGYVVIWDLTIMRPRVVWKAHENAILGIMEWGSDRIITHGRDHKLIVWKLSAEDEEPLSRALPLEDTPNPRPQPWILHLLEVNAMNFCCFSMCAADSGQTHSPGVTDDTAEILIAVPNTLHSEEIDIYSLPSQTRIHTISPGKGSGMAMALSLIDLEASLTMMVAFEDGRCSVHRLQPDGQWVITYRTQAHTQPILSLEVHPSYEFFLTSSADAVIAKHPIPLSQQELIPELDPNNCIVEEIIDAPDEANLSLLSAALKGTTNKKSTTRGRVTKEWENPLKIINTKHAGQQGLKIRSDGRIFSTAGWDSNIRVYSCKTLKELAVLQWHKVGCYAVAFADVEKPQPTSNREPMVPHDEAAPVSAVVATADCSSRRSTMDVTVTQRKDTAMSVKDRRIQQAKMGHWIAAGSKDGKVSLWDIY